jgi:hypothetical protein
MKIAPKFWILEPNGFAPNSFVLLGSQARPPDEDVANWLSENVAVLKFKETDLVRAARAQLK